MANYVWTIEVTCTEHEKIYSSVVYYTDPLQFPWVCAKCGAQGKDWVDKEPYPKGDRRKYDTVVRMLRHD